MLILVKERKRIKAESHDLPIRPTIPDIAVNLGDFVWMFMFYRYKEGGADKFIYYLETYRLESKTLTLINARYTDDIISLLSKGNVYDQLNEF